MKIAQNVEAACDFLLEFFKSLLFDLNRLWVITCISMFKSSIAA